MREEEGPADDAMLELLFNHQKLWSEKAFGPYDGRRNKDGRIGVAKHLAKEAMEVVCDEENGDAASAIGEVADVFILAIELAHLYGLSPSQIYHLVRSKQVVNSHRRWGEAKPGEPIEHVK